MTFPVLLDDTDTYPVSNAYGLTNVPSFFWISEDRNIEISSVGWSRRDFDEMIHKAASATDNNLNPFFIRRNNSQISARVEGRKTSPQVAGIPFNEIGPTNPEMVQLRRITSVPFPSIVSDQYSVHRHLQESSDAEDRFSGASLAFIRFRGTSWTQNQPKRNRIGPSSSGGHRGTAKN